MEVLGRQRCESWVDGWREDFVYCVVTEPVALVKRAHGRAVHNSRSSFGAHGAYLATSVAAVFAVSVQSCTFQIQEKK